MAKRYPPAIANNPARMVSQQRCSDILDQVFTRATEFSLANTLGWYKRARLGSAFKRELKEMDYDDKFIDRATEHLIVVLSRRASPNS